MQLFVDNLTNSDFCYLDAQRGLLGETWLSDVLLHGTLDDQGMVCDFGQVKREVRNLLDEYIDHRLLVPGLSAQVQIQERGEELFIEWQNMDSDERIEHRSPIQCVTIIDTETIDKHSVAQWCQQQLQKRLPNTIDKIDVGFKSELIEGPYYHYSHGLKKHDGKCQRIAHGHRSKIEIWKDNTRQTHLENQWAKILEDSYIGTSEDQIASKKKGHLCFEYEAREGKFHLTLPRSRVTLINTDSTVENIAQYIASEIKSQYPGDSYLVKAFEGINKGAITQTSI